MATGSVTRLGNLFIRGVYSAKYNINANDYHAISNTDFGCSTPTGYVPFAIATITSGSAYVTFTVASVTPQGSDDVILRLREVGGSKRTDLTAKITIIYVKEGFFVI